MIKIVLYKFLVWPQLELEIPLGKTILLKGPNDSGKSTLLAAVAWAIHGGNESVTPTREPNADTWVTVGFPTMVITRKRVPKQLIVQLGSLTLHDQGAQAEINKYFGNRDIWLASCYILQGEWNNFFGQTNSGKLSILNSIAFSEEDPKLFIDQIEGVIKDCEFRLNNLLNLYNRDREICARTNTPPMDLSLALTPEAVTDLETQLSLRTTQVRDLEASQQQRLVNLQLLARMTEQLSSYTTERAKLVIPSLSLDQFPTILSCPLISDLTSLVDLFTERDRLSHRIASLKNLPTLIHTDQDLTATISSEQAYQTSSQWYSSIKLPYNESIRQQAIAQYGKLITDQETHRSQLSTIDSLTSQLASHKTNLQNLTDRITDSIAKLTNHRTNSTYLISEIGQLKTHDGRYISQLTNLTNEIANLSSQLKIPSPEPLPSIDDRPFDSTEFDNQLKESQDSLTSLTSERMKIIDQITEARKSDDLIPCPHCHHQVRIQNGKLIASTDPPLDQGLIQSIIISEQELATKIQSTRDQIIHRQNQLTVARRNHDQKLAQAYQLNSARQAEIQQWLTTQHKNQLAIKDLDNQITTITAQQSHGQVQIVKLESELITVHGTIEDLTIINGQLISDQNEIKRLIATVEAQLNTLTPAKILSPAEEAHIRLIITRLQESPILALPSPSSQEILGLMNAHRELQELPQLETQLTAIVGQIPTIYQALTKVQLTSLISHISNHQTLVATIQSKQEQYDHALSKIQGQIAEISNGIPPDHEQSIKHLHLWILQQQNRLRYNVAIQKLLVMAKDLDAQNVAIEQLKSEVIALKDLKQSSINAEYQVLDLVVNSVNNSIDHTCSEMFTRQITIAMDLFRRLKSTGQLKPQINFKVHHDQDNYDNVNRISFGMRARVSIALTLALHNMSGCPLLMMDEPLGSIDRNVKTATIKAIGRNTTSAVLIASHDVSDGDFDLVIDLSQFRKHNSE